MKESDGGALTVHAQDRPIAARSPRPRTLDMRLALSVALSVAAVVGVVTLAALQMAQRQLDTDLRETARLTAVALADDIELRDEHVTADTLLPLLRDFMAAAVDLYSISVFNVENDRIVPLVTTSVVAPAPADFIQTVVHGDEVSWTDSIPHIAMVGVPVRRGDVVTGVVIVAVSLGSIEQLRRTVGFISAGAALFAIVAITLLIHLLARRLILEPLHEIRGVIARARSGDLSVRAVLKRRDEMTEVAEGLNSMLTELDDLHRSLNQRVATATGELRQSNEQLVRSYESVLQLRETAARAQQLAAIGQTMANVAHQIGTPLNLVSGHVQLLQQQFSDPALRRRLEIVEEQVGRVVSAVRDLLERARPHSMRTTVSISALFDRLSEAMRARLAVAGVQLVTHVEAGLPGITADETQLELAILNLVTNAIDAMPAGGTLTLVAEPAASGVRLEIHDTGAGIPADLLPRIFDPWVTTKTTGRGSGLGLSITRDVVTSLGGTISVSSTAGVGSTFKIELPTTNTAVHA